MDYREYRELRKFRESLDSWRAFSKIFLPKNENTFHFFIFCMEDFLGGKLSSSP
jgi:hypothetical protein